MFNLRLIICWLTFSLYVVRFDNLLAAGRTLPCPWLYTGCRPNFTVSVVLYWPHAKLYRVVVIYWLLAKLYGVVVIYWFQAKLYGVVVIYWFQAKLYRVRGYILASCQTLPCRDQT